MKLTRHRCTILSHLHLPQSSRRTLCPSARRCRCHSSGKSFWTACHGASGANDWKCATTSQGPDPVVHLQGLPKSQRCPAELDLSYSRWAVHSADSKSDSCLGHSPRPCPDDRVVVSGPWWQFQQEAAPLQQASPKPSWHPSSLQFLHRYGRFESNR